MAQFVKRKVIVEAVQWWGPDDHPGITPGFNDGRICPECGATLGEHGHYQDAGGLHLVCPGDWILMDSGQNLTIVKPNIFEATYMPIEEALGGWFN